MKETKKTEKIQVIQQEAQKEIKEAQKEVKGAKQEVKSLKSENEKLQSLLIDVIKNQQNSHIREWVNILCWIICFALLIAEYFRAS